MYFEAARHIQALVCEYRLMRTLHQSSLNSIPARTWHWHWQEHSCEFGGPSQDVTRNTKGIIGSEGSLINTSLYIFTTPSSLLAQVCGLFPPLQSVCNPATQHWWRLERSDNSIYVFSTTNKRKVASLWYPGFMPYHTDQVCLNP